MSTAANVARDDAFPAGEPWPQGISRRATMRISDVLDALRSDFPAVSHSKLRFLEEQGLIEPVRTTSGYRQYSAADVERLRFVLVEQRDRYLPLKVIKERLAELDAGVGGPGPGVRVAAGPDDDAVRLPARFTVETLAQAASVPTTLVDALVDAGVLRKSAAGQLDASALDVVTIAAALGEHGIEPRHLRSLRSASDRHVSLVQQVVAPWRSQQTTSARAHAESVATELGELCARLHTVWVRQGIEDITS